MQSTTTKEETTMTASKTALTVTRTKHGKLYRYTDGDGNVILKGSTRKSTHASAYRRQDGTVAYWTHGRKDLAVKGSPDANRMPHLTRIPGAIEIIDGEAVKSQQPLQGTGTVSRRKAAPAKSAKASKPAPVASDGKVWKTRDGKVFASRAERRAYRKQRALDATTEEQAERRAWAARSDMG